VALALALLLGACGDDDDPSGNAGAGTPADLQFRPVLEELPPDAPTAPDVVTETVRGETVARYRVGPSADPEVRVASATVADPHAGSYGVVLVLGEASQERFTALAGRCYERDGAGPTGQVAVVVAGNVVSSPTIESPSGFHEIRISGDFNRRRAQELVALLTSPR
jgi:preprotein translocase subunit SecD